MIKSLRGTETERLFRREPVKRFAQIAQAARRRLAFLNSASSLSDLRVPAGNRLEALRGDRDGQYSIRINSQYRICFTWKEKDAYNVEITKHFE